MRSSYGIFVSLLCCALALGIAGCREKDTDRSPANEPAAPNVPAAGPAAEPATEPAAEPAAAGEGAVSVATVAVVNERCPIMGTRIDSQNVPAALTRDFRNKKVGFCCPACPPQWDKLGEDEKQAKLDAAMGQ